jgi:hypothetical protein
MAKKTVGITLINLDEGVKKKDIEQVKPLMGLAVMHEDYEKAMKIIKGLQVKAELVFLTGNRFFQLVAETHDGLDAISDLQRKFNTRNIHCFIALRVPELTETEKQEKEPKLLDSGVATGTCVSTSRLPFQTQYNNGNGGYAFTFTRPTYWAIRVVVYPNGSVKYTGQLMGQDMNEDKNWKFRPMSIVKQFDNIKQAQKEFRPDKNILSKLTNKTKKLMPSLGHHRQRLHRSVRSVEKPFTHKIPGLEGLEIPLNAEEGEKNTAVG